MNGQAQPLELPGKVTRQKAKHIVHNMLQLRKCFPCRIRSMAMSSGCLIVIFSVNNSIHINVKNRKQVTKKKKEDEILKTSH